MMPQLLVVLGPLIAGLGVVVAIAWMLRRERAAWRMAIRQFRWQREQLEARFFDLAVASGKPRGLRWVECDWLPTVQFARDRMSGLLTAFVHINVRFEAIAGEDMEDVPAVGLVRDASAVFHWRRGIWGTGGRTLFNVTPEAVMRQLSDQYEPIEQRTGAMSGRLKFPAHPRR
jgi:hypothetical protein